jgi:Flp pilus assembly pilin Flp
MLQLFTYVHSLWLAALPDRDEQGQASAEYALVVLGAAAIAVLVAAWAGSTDRIGQLFDFVLDKVKGKAGK